MRASYEDGEIRARIVEVVDPGRRDEIDVRGTTAF
jgi:hypothetical protein